MRRAASAAPDRRGARAESCWSDVTQNPRAARPRRRGEIPCPPHDRLMAQEREGDRFLRFAVEKQLIEEYDRARLNLRRQPLDERRILCAAAGDDDLRTDVLPPPRDRSADR